MARQISVSDEVYEKLSRLKGTRSFSEVIKEAVIGRTDNEKTAKDIMKFAGILKKNAKELDEFNRQILKERRANTGRNLDW